MNVPSAAESKMETSADQMSQQSSTTVSSTESIDSQKRNNPSPRRGIHIEDVDLASRLDQYSIEDVVELKISRFFDQIGTFYPENVFDLIMSKVEKPLLIQILRRVGGNQVQAAKILGINRNTLRKKIKLYGL